jgi:uncharacterized protein YjbI with pentapeptide repeats
MTFAQKLADHKLWVESDGDKGERLVLAGADLRNSNLKGADLRGAELRGADLRDTDLRGGIFNGAIIYRDDLDDADIRERSAEDGED